MAGDAGNIVVDNMGIVGVVIKKHFAWMLNIYDYDDLFQVGCLGLIHAAKQYKGKLLQYSFTTVATYHIRSFLHNEARKLYQAKREKELTNLSLDAEIAENCSLNDIVTDKPDVFNDIENKVTLEQLYRQLNEREIVVINMRLEGYKQQEIAKLLNVSQSYAARIENGAIKKMQQAT